MPSNKVWFPGSPVFKRIKQISFLGTLNRVSLCARILEQGVNQSRTQRLLAFWSAGQKPEDSGYEIGRELRRSANYMCNTSLRKKRFRAVSEKRTRNESQRPRISRAAKTENLVPQSFFAPKLNGNIILMDKTINLYAQ